MSELPERIRSFISIALDPGVAREAEGLRRRLERKLPADAVRWVPAEQLHLTLKFLGSIPRIAVEDVAADLRRICGAHRRFRLRAEGVGCFPSMNSPRVIWIGLAGDVSVLQRLQEVIEEATGRWAQKEEHRPFSAHLTIGRVREEARGQARRIGEVVQGTAVQLLGEWEVDSVQLMRSQLSPHGATHTVLAAAPLALEAKRG